MHAGLLWHCALWHDTGRMPVWPAYPAYCWRPAGYSRLAPDGGMLSDHVTWCDLAGALHCNLRDPLCVGMLRLEMMSHATVSWRNKNHWPVVVRYSWQRAVNNNNKITITNKILKNNKTELLYVKWNWCRISGGPQLDTSLWKLKLKLFHSFHVLFRRPERT